MPDNGSTEEAKCEDLEKIIVSDDLEKFFQVSFQLPPQEREELIEFFRKNDDVFAWSAYEAPGVDPNFICHYLNVNPSVIPKKQPPRRSSKDHSDAIKDEVTKLKQEGAIKEVFHPNWQVNIVVVKKNNGKWRVCGFHGFKQGLPKRFLPYASNKPTSRCDCRLSSDELFRCISRILSNTTS